MFIERIKTVSSERRLNLEMDFARMLFFFLLVLCLSNAMRSHTHTHKHCHRHAHKCTKAFLDERRHFGSTYQRKGNTTHIYTDRVYTLFFALSCFDNGKFSYLVFPPKQDTAMLRFGIYGFWLALSVLHPLN